MRMLKTFLVAAMFLLLSGPLSAQANLIWNWTGTCDGIVTPIPPGQGGGSVGCVGQASAHFETSDSYVPGTEGEPDQLLAWTYADANVNVDLLPFFLRDPTGFDLPVASGLTDGSVDAIAAEFHSTPSGWLSGAEGIRPGCDGGGICGYEARGFNGIWTRVPEPSSLVLLALGLLGVVFACRADRPVK